MTPAKASKSDGRKPDKKPANQPVPASRGSGGSGRGLPPASVPAPSRDTPARRRAVVAVLFLGTLLLFGRAVFNDFVNYDDPDYVTANAHVRAGLTWAGVRWAFFSSDVSYWHPLTWLSHMADWQLYGERPAGHHATSIAWHALAAAMAFLALRRLTGAFWTSAVGAALFAWHPLRVESVAWVAERKDVLGGFFWLLALWAYAGYAEKRRAGIRAWGSYTLALGAFAAGLMSKPMLVTLPCVLLLLDFWPLGRVPVGARLAAWRALIVEKIPFFALSFAVAAITVVAQKNVGTLSTVLSFDARLANAAVAVVRYVGKFFVPVNLAVLYPHPGTWPPEKVAFGAVFVLGATALAVAQMRRRPWLLAGWLWFLGALVPVSGLVQVGIQSMADRYTYAPILGLQLALLWTVRETLTPATRRIWACVAAVVLAACAVRTVDQLGVWKNSLTLFGHTVAVTEKNYLAWNNHGTAQSAAGRIDEAIADYRRSLAIKPDYAEANSNLGSALDGQGRAKEALPFLRAAVRLKPGLLEAHLNLGTALADAGEFDEAFAEFETVLARQPDHAKALDNYGVALAMSDRLPQAIAKIEAALRLQPDDAGAHSNLGNALSLSGQNDAAIAHYRRALELKPGEAQTHNNLANAYIALGRLDEAVASYERALSLRSINPEAHANLGGVLLRLGRRDAAIAHLRTALQQRPDYAQAKAWLDAAMASAPSAAPAATGK